MNRLHLLILICQFAAVPHIANAETEDPFGGVDSEASSESKPRMVTEAGKKTLEILRTERLDKITLNPGDQQKGFETIKAVLAKRGITVRLKSNGEPKKKHLAGGPLDLHDIPLEKFMQYFDQWALYWGWILYPDGSITYFDSQCAGALPKNGLYCHDSQYEAGKPEVMSKKQKEANDNPSAEQ